MENTSNFQPGDGRLRLRFRIESGQIKDPVELVGEDVLPGAEAEARNA